ncbi:MAG: GntR family transcriptional regulator [Mariniblastus sp.]|nr:GntR family transcriptional regulator [Mariniblastus sp.]
MFFNINQTNGVPVYEQISRQIAFAIASEGIAVGELVPSVRNLSRDLAVNPNTVARAYRQLQDEGILESVRGEGLLVTPTAVKQCKILRKQLLSERMLQVMEEARQSHLSDDEVEKMVASCLQKSKTSYAKNRSSL